MAVTVRDEMHVVHETKKDKDMTQDARIATRCGELLHDIAAYIDELTNDRLHDRWEEWTGRMDDVADELKELNDDIGQLEDSSKQRMLEKKLKEIDPENRLHEQGDDADGRP